MTNPKSPDSVNITFDEAFASGTRKGKDAVNHNTNGPVEMHPWGPVNNTFSARPRPSDSDEPTAADVVEDFSPSDPKGSSAQVRADSLDSMGGSLENANQETLFNLSSK